MRKKHSIPWTTVVIVALTLICGTVLAEELGQHARAVRYGARVKTVLHVADADGTAVSDAEVWAGFPCHSTAKSSNSTVRTDTNGMATLEGISSGELIFRISKSGYYKTEGKLRLGQGDEPVRDGCWQPWGSTNTATLKQKINPVPMYAKKVEARFPVRETAIAFDLVKGDWIAPYGGGEVGDLILTAKGVFTSYQERWSTVEIVFSNEGDGLQVMPSPKRSHVVGSSEFVSPYQAPLEGYASQWRYEKRITPEVDDRVNAVPVEGVNLVYRVRTIRDTEGNIIRAMYGKTYGQIVCDFEDPETIGVYFTYYLNPDGTRNLEFDPNQDLFTNGARKVWRP